MSTSNVVWCGFQPPAVIQNLTVSIMRHAGFRRALHIMTFHTMTNSKHNDELGNVDSEKFIREHQAQVSLNSVACDQPGRRLYGSTEKAKDGSIEIFLSKAMWEHYESLPEGPDKATLGFLIAVSVAHEWGQYFFRTALGEDQTEIKRLLSIRNAGYLVDRLLFSPLNLNDGGLVLFATVTEQRRTWFGGERGLHGFQLGIRIPQKQKWILLAPSYIQSCYDSATFRGPKGPDFKTLTTPPGNIAIRSAADVGEQRISPDIEVVNFPPGTVVFRRHCIHETKAPEGFIFDPDESDED